MPKLWTETIQGHRNTVAEAIMDKTAELADVEGLHSLTMARIAQEVGIGRATLYKYFSDVEQILGRWHERQVASHLDELVRIRADSTGPLAALESTLTFYATNARRDHTHSLGALFHSMPHVRKAHIRLQRLVADLIDEAAREGAIRAESSPEELARFALAAISAAGRGNLSKPALQRLVTMILRGIGA